MEIFFSLPLGNDSQMGFAFKKIKQGLYQKCRFLHLPTRAFGSIDLKHGPGICLLISILNDWEADGIWMLLLEAHLRFSVFDKNISQRVYRKIIRRVSTHMIDEEKKYQSHYVFTGNIHSKEIVELESFILMFYGNSLLRFFPSLYLCVTWMT